MSLERGAGRVVGVVVALIATGLLVQTSQSQEKAAPDPSKSIGSKNAPITVEVFSDFECPACRRLYQETLRPLKEDYVATGKVYLVHRDFPLQIHRFSWQAAKYVNAAAHIGRFEPVVEAVFSKQEVWSTTGDVRSAVASVLTPAELRRVEDLVQSDQIKNAIEKDIAMGRAIPVQSTPTILIRHNQQVTNVPGTVAYSMLKKFLDQQLRQ